MRHTRAAIHLRHVHVPASRGFRSNNDAPTESLSLPSRVIPSLSKSCWIALSISSTAALLILEGIFGFVSCFVSFCQSLSASKSRMSGCVRVEMLISSWVCISQYLKWACRIYINATFLHNAPFIWPPPPPLQALIVVGIGECSYLWLLVLRRCCFKCSKFSSLICCFSLFWWLTGSFKSKSRVRASGSWEWGEERWWFQAVSV